MTRSKSNFVPPADPRANQKNRTRAALVEAATRLLRQGTQPTVAEAAELAQVSRATAYRYFPTQEALLVEIAQLNPTVEPVERWIAGLEDGAPAERLHGLLDNFNRLAVAEEATLRTGLRVYLETWLQARQEGAEPALVREGRRTRWLDEVLAPARARLKPVQWRRLRSALSLTLGVEALVVMKDVCKLPDEESLATLDWAAQALLGAALQDADAADAAAAQQRRKRA